MNLKIKDLLGALDLSGSNLAPDWDFTTDLASQDRKKIKYDYLKVRGDKQVGLKRAMEILEKELSDRR